MKKKHSGSPAHGHYQERRRFSRVAFDRGAWLTMRNKRQRFEQLGNLSMGGACVHGHSSLQAGDICHLEIHDYGRHATRVVKFCVRIVRKEGDCLALEFVDMDVDGFMFLQTLVLYSADDPLGVVAEFQDNFSRPSMGGTC